MTRKVEVKAPTKLKKKTEKSQEKTDEKPKLPSRIVYIPEPTMEPTPERFAKSEFSKIGPKRVILTVQALFKAGTIGDPEVQAAERLKRDLLLARDGYRDPPLEPYDSIVHHDQLSWHMTRAFTWVEIGKLRAKLRPIVFDLLNLMIGDEMSFSGIARVLKRPSSTTISAADRHYASAQCTLCLKLLVAAYDEFDAERRTAARASRQAEKNIKVMSN